MKSTARRTVDINIFGKEYQLKFTINAIEMFESTTEERNISIIVTKPAWSMREIISGLHAGLKWQLPKLTRDQVKAALPELIRNNSLLEVQAWIVAAIGLSGLVFGDSSRSPFAEIMPEESGENSPDEDDEEKK